MPNAPDRIEIYHPKLTGFEQFLKSCTGSSTDSIDSTARILLPFQVQQKMFEKCNPEWVDSNAWILYVELCSHEERRYGAVQDDRSYEIC